jgi:protein-disulfide isomerase
MEADCRVRRALGVAVLALSLAAASPAWATHQSREVGGFDKNESRDIEEIVREYILDHPQVILEAVQKLRARQQQAEEQRRREAAGAVTRVDGEDHIRGNPDAPVKVIEFSDFECPFCKRFHQTMKRLLDDYGSDGEVAWVYRHFPIDSLHSKARKEAQAAECAGEVGGNEAFWAYADRLFEVTPSNDGLDLGMLPQLAEEIGLDRARFEACLDGDMRGGEYAAHIEADFQDASASGGAGTPYTVVVGPDGQSFPINGAQPYAAVKSIIELALKGQ